MKKGFFKKTGALMLAATLTVSMVQVPVYGATTKTVTVSNQKQLNKALKVAKGKKAYSIIVKAGKNTKVTIPKKNWVNHFSYGFSPKCFRLSPSCRHP